MLEKWWDEYAIERLEESTLQSYKTGVWRLLEVAGNRNAAQLTTADLIGVRDELHLTYSVRATNSALTVLGSAYQRHVEWGLLANNVARGVPKLPETRKAIIMPTAAEIRLLAENAPTNLERAMLITAAYLGLRQSELFAIKWADIHADRITIARAKTVSQNTKGVKTRSERVIPIPTVVSDELRKLPRSAEWVFPNQSGDLLNKSNWLKRVYQPWRRRVAWDYAAATGDSHGAHRIAGMQWRHLRHYYASTLSRAGATILQCSRWMGHGSIVTTMDRYGELFEEDTDTVMTRINDLA